MGETANHEANDPLPAWWQWALARPGRSHWMAGESGLLHYLRWGDTASKPPLLLVHGFRAHAHWWDMVAPFLVEHYQVFAVDLSGMGDSDHRQSYDPYCHAGDIVRFIETLGLGAVTAVGHSFGGGRLLQACAEHPALFVRAVVVDSHQLFAGVSIPDDPVGHTRARRYPSLAAAVSRFRLAPPQPQSLDYLVQHVARHSVKPAEAVRPAEDEWTWKFDPRMTAGMFALADADQLLPTVVTPVDVVYGSESEVVPDAMARRVHGALGRPGKRICIPGGHHHLMLDQPAALIATLRALL